jgi:hypothetical protein
MTPELRRRLADVAAPAVVVVAAVIARIQLVFATRLPWYDDGVFLASVMAMRRGELPFHDVFSSQGPVFLPVAWLFDVVGLRHIWSARLSMMIAGIIIALCVYVICDHLTSRWAASALGVVAAISGTILPASGPLQSDGMAMAFGLMAFTVATKRADRRWAPYVAGLLVGMALATKSLLVLPLVVGTVVIFLVLRRFVAVLVIGAVAALTGLAVALPFGLNNVWEQYIEFHTTVPRNIDVSHNIARVWQYLFGHDLLVIALVGIAAIAALWTVWRRRRSTVSEDGPSFAIGQLMSDNVVVIGAVAWLICSLGVLIFLSELESGRIRYVGFIVPPLLVLVAASQLRSAVVIAAVVVFVPFHIDSNDGYFDPRPMSGREQAAVSALEQIPPGALVVTDAPGLAIAADRGVATEMVDTSYARIDAGDITSEDVIAAASNDEVCAVLIISGRFNSLDADLPDELGELGYQVTKTFGGDRLLMQRAGGLGVC